jgi:YHS domain-containing protein
MKQEAGHWEELKMKRMIVLALLVVFMMPLAASRVFSADETGQAGIPTIPARSRGLDGQSSQTGIVDVGNKICPVMGGPVNGEDSVVYEGKRYGLCCPGCDKTFLSDPAKYVAKVHEEKSAAAAADPASQQMEKDMEQGSL